MTDADELVRPTHTDAPTHHRQRRERAEREAAWLRGVLVGLAAAGAALAAWEVLRRD